MAMGESISFFATGVAGLLQSVRDIIELHIILSHDRDTVCL